MVTHVPATLTAYTMDRLFDYHVEVEAHYYSVPHRFVRAEVEVRFTSRTVVAPRSRCGCCGWIRSSSTASR
jgi:hypothetical protein